MAGAVLIAVAALVAYGWVGDLPFQLDDYTVAAQAEGMLTRRPAEGGGAYLFRPVHWLVMTLESRVSGTPFDPRVFHFGSLLLHALASLAVFWLLRGVLSPGGAVFGALFFAVHGAGAEAVSWVAAAGDVLLVLFAAVAGRLLVDGGPVRTGLAGLALAAAFGSKATAFGLLPVFGLAVLSWPRGRTLRRRLIDAGVLFAPVMAMVAARRWYLGTWSLSYAGGSSAGVESFDRMLETAPALFRALLLPWNTSPELDAVCPLLVPLEGLASMVAPDHGRELVAALMLVLPVGALFFGLRRYAPRFALGGAVLGLFAAPALFAAPNAEHVFSRALYLPVVPLGFLFGAAAECWRGDHGWRRGLRWAAVGLTALLTIDSQVHLARAHGQLRDRSLAYREAIEAELTRVDDEVVVIVVDDPARSFLSMGGMPILGPLAEEAFVPPFRARQAVIRYVPREHDLVSSGILFQRPCPLPIRILRVRGDRLVSGARLPAIPKTVPALRKASEPEGRPMWRPTSPVPPRVARAVRIPLAPGPAGRVVVVLETDRGRIERSRQLAGAEDPRSLVFILDAEPQWFLAAELRGILVEGPGAAGGAAPELLEQAPRLDVDAPAEDAVLPMSERPAFEITGLPAGRSLLAEFRFGDADSGIDLVVSVAAKELEQLAEGRVRYRPQDGDTVLRRSPDHLDWRILPALFDQHLGSRGVKELNVRVRFAALGDDGKSREARSEWRAFRLRR